MNISGGSDELIVYMISTPDSYKALTGELKGEDKTLFEQGWKYPQGPPESKIEIY
jgi:hypothetical protein